MRESRSEQLLSDALSLPVEDRHAFISGACADDATLQAELLSLLEHAAPAEAFFASLAQVVVRELPPPGLHAGRFEILECIGVGGMGAVYRAHDARLDRDVALKFLPAQHSAASVDNRLLHEARAVAALEHPNICTIHEIAETADGRSFIAMTLYDGETLRDRMARAPMSVRESMDIAIQAARGLVAAHAQDIVHRDIKPGNIMLTAAGVVKILDFGLATTADAAVRPGGVPGTVSYMSPEQIRGEIPGPQSDLWSLGVVIYEMLAGSRPFHGDGQADRMASILGTTPTPLRRIDRRIPVRLEQIVTRLLERDTADRYPTADELLRDLAHAQSAYARTISSLLPSRRSRMLAAAAAVMLLFSAAVLWRQLAHGTDSVQSIALLSFESPADDPAQQYLADGFRDELIAELTGLQALRVVGQYSVARFRGSTGDVQAIGRAVRAGSVLSGTVQTMGDSIQVTAELRRTADGARTFTRTYRMPLGQLPALRHDIARDVALALDVPLSTTERELLANRAAVNPDALTSYLRGRYFWNQRTATSFARAIEHFERALEHDSLFAPAYAGLAAVYMQQGMAGQVHVAEAAERSRVAAERAVAIDDNSADAHSVLALYLHAYAWDSKAAEREFRRALELDRGQSMTHQYYSVFLRSELRLDEAIMHGARAVELDPLVPGFSETLAMTLWRAGRSDAALQRIRSAIELDSTYWRAQAVLGGIHESLHRPAEAIRAYERANQLAGRAAHRTTADLARVFAQTGDTNRARQLLDTLRVVAERSGAYEAATATVIFALGDDDSAFHWLETAFRQKQPHLRFIDGDARYLPLARDPRFDALMQRVGVRHPLPD